MQLPASLVRRSLWAFAFVALILFLTHPALAKETLKGRTDPSYRNLSGTNFTVSVPNVEAGRYVAVLGFVETEFTNAGERTFDIIYRQQLVATNLDVFAAAGGADKLFFLKVPVQHAADIEGGPLAFKFIGRKGDAILNSLELKSLSGATIFYLKATDMMPGGNDAAAKPPTVPGPVLWKDPTQPADVRVKDLVSRMSLAEKVAQLRNGAPPIWRLGLPGYDYWSECLHGVARAGTATVFPQAIGMAATWDAPLIHQVADTIATEARAKHNQYAQLHDGDSVRYVGLTFWTPNINLVRDPRWGRGQETYGEDPFLTGQLAVAFIRGLQGENLPGSAGAASDQAKAPKYLKAMACAKHFAVYSGPEWGRQGFNAQPPERDLFESYLPQFEAAVREGHVGAIMGAYTALNGEPACSNPFLLTDLLRNQWGFDGHVVSDCGAINNIFALHKIVATPEEAAVRALKAGCDLCCGTNYDALVDAVQRGLVDEHTIDVSLERVLTARFRLGLFDPPASVPYAQIPITENDSPGHRQLALQTARESIVLLKNNGLLPLQRSKIKRIAVIGVNADSVPMLLGDYNGTPSAPVTILDGIRRAVTERTEIAFAPGCPLARKNGAPDPAAASALSNAVEIAKSADVILYVGGLSPELEGEEMPVDYQGFHGGDRTRIELPAPQTELLKALHATGKPVVFINCSGSAVAMPWAVANLPAILQAWYPGEAGGEAVADVLFGDANPAGRLPVTFYASTQDLPAFEDYSMSNRTYRYFNGKPEFAFGHGLSYTRFSYGKPHLSSTKLRAGDTLHLSFVIKNTGSRDGDEVAQVYFRHVDSKVPQPKLSLCGFARVHIAKKQSANVGLEIPVEQFRYWDTQEKRYVVEAGAYELLIGSASDDIRTRLLFNIM